MPVLKILGPVALIATLTAGTSAHATDRAIIVFDGSGSMWGQIDGKPKLEIARQALRDMLETVPDTMELGLMAYGHREKGNCSDIETLVAPAANTKAAIVQAVQNMRFLGKTPLSAAVQQAAAELRHTEDKATVILITDGEETCNADPCALGTELKQSGVDFTAHVVGLGLTKQQGEQVSCLAHNTGGQYFAADDAARLSHALNAAMQATRAATPEPEPEPALPPVTLDAPEVAGAGVMIEIGWTGPDAPGDYVTIIDPQESDIQSGAYERTERGNPIKLQTPGTPGHYEVRYVMAERSAVLARQTIQLVPVGATVSGPESVGAGGWVTVQWTGPDSPGDYITVVKAGAPDAKYNDYARTSSGNPVRVVAPDSEGRYEIRYVLDKSTRVLASQPLILAPVSASLELVGNAVPGGTATVAWTGPNNRGDYITIVPKGAPAAKYLDYARTEPGAPVTIRLPQEPGEYELRYVMDSSKRVLASLPLTLPHIAADNSIQTQGDQP